MLERVREACYLRAFMPNNRDFVMNMDGILGCYTQKSDNNALYHFLETIYNYGRVEGIRQERSHRKAVRA